MTERKGCWPFARPEARWRQQSNSYDPIVLAPQTSGGDSVSGARPILNCNILNAGANQPAKAYDVRIFQFNGTAFVDVTSTYHTGPIAKVNKPANQVTTPFSVTLTGLGSSFTPLILAVWCDAGTDPVMTLEFQAKN